jgi:RimJ/RimL family protein N-acetyltransferase
MSELTLSHDSFATERLRLRRLRPSDASLLTLYASDARVAKMTTGIPHPYPPGLGEAYVERVGRPGGREIVWAIDSGADEENGLIGMIGLKLRADASAELTYWIAPAFWGAGYASEAVEGVVRHADAMEIPVLTAQVFQDNERAARALTRAGFAYLGEDEAHSVARGAMVPTFRYRREARQ